MNDILRTARMRRRIDRLLLGRLPARQVPEVLEHLRAQQRARADYDQAIEAFRALEHEVVAQAELDLVEGWLFDQPSLKAAARAPRWRWWGVGLVAAAAMVLVFAAVSRVPSRAPDSDGFAVRGGGAGGLALDAVCVSVGASNGVSTDAQQHGCDLESTLSFAYRLDRPLASDAALTLFGFDSERNVMYYTPTPVDQRPRWVAAGVTEPRWEPLSLSVRLSVNHDPGRLRVFGLVSPSALSVSDVDQTAVLLGGLPPSSTGDPPWHERLHSGVVSTMCQSVTQCYSAELELQIHKDSR